MNILNNIESIRKEFPILNTTVNGNKLIYLDNAATSQTPNCVMESISNYYKNLNSNIHRGVHTLSQIATEKYGAKNDDDIDIWIRAIQNVFDNQDYKYYRVISFGLNQRE